MGAVAGVIRAARKIEAEEEERVIRTLETYQSDALQVWRDEGAVIACAHQWLTSESVGERLPFVYKDRFVVTSDAVLDNRKDLFYDLDIHPSRRRYMTDTMLLARAFEKWGLRMVYKVLGSFAVSVWDRQEQKLFLFRDSSGSRTLYYFHRNNTAAFSSTKEVLFQLPEAGKKFNDDWIAQFIALPSNVEALDMNITVFRDIQQVPPSAVVIISEEKTAVKQYSLIDPHYRITLSRDEEYEEVLRSILAESVRSKLRSIGKQGSLLYGGLESGIVASIAGRELSYPLHTYTVKPKEDFYDWADSHKAAEEIKALEETVRCAGNIKNKMLTLDGSHPLEKLDNHLTMLETPFKSTDTFFRREEVHEAAKKDSVRVLLNGFRGGDTISWGSHRLNHYYYTELLKKMKWKQLNGELSSYAARYGMARTKLLPVMAKKALRQKIRDSGSMPNWINPDLAKKTGVFELCRKYSYPLSDPEEHDLSDFRKRSLMQNFHWNNEGTASAKLSLHTGLWERDPTDDYRVIQFCLAIPEEQFVKHGLERSLARRASRNILPESVRFLPHRDNPAAADAVYRMKEAWGDFCLEAEEMVREGRLAEWVDMTYIAKIAEEIPGCPTPSYGEDVRFRILSRCLVLNRFIKMHELG
ncbi:asparagine synthase-related protein [Alkalicoccus saliphilus]|uniref:asparagine synthase (glutamine-hydrolyzing) n=1 Tax=Alkalicoccus saliphilus TaxID=200989 RepID=A0A2T4U2H6_9BACI|nr:asparagine synthase-related protein [Alkalicoccus saliphilus]PTL37555.1 hypothetical protein C6Y45_15920 [Alkalicoccus saliphilus]